MRHLKLIFLITTFLLVNSLLLSSQTVYHEASEFPLIGKITPETETRYERLPAYLKNSVSRPAIWSLGKNTSGLAIRFNSNSTSISAKWEVLQNVSMNHMTETGIKGLDLYAWENNKWQFVNTARPTAKQSEQVIISNMTPKDREFMLFLPLYDGLTTLSIGIDSLSHIRVPRMNLPATKNPIVVYGTSITQGGCASRPGMSYTNILTRWMNREFINLGFSGNGQLDYEIAEVMAKREDVDLFVLDFIPNVTEEKIKNRTQHFVNIIRKENPETPILLVESVIFPHSVFDTSTDNILTVKNRALRAEFDQLKNSGDKNIYYLESDDLLGDDGEGTVDGVHLTDLGFQRFAKVLMKKINSILP
ncbi:MAG: SGNH/GDSL hydrolase family protein [Dysgonamonadaceae bacterium]|nr:SGNH/GDSL hydrolase family protein [Dysgonamonadaceae bacterium]MDD4606537.1 SGNH/GDSL hydrolase family protein [Dysgonamonadaceae bacterium]